MFYRGSLSLFGEWNARLYCRRSGRGRFRPLGVELAALLCIARCVFARLLRALSRGLCVLYALLRQGRVFGSALGLIDSRALRAFGQGLVMLALLMHQIALLLCLFSFEFRALLGLFLSAFRPFDFAFRIAHRDTARFDRAFEIARFNIELARGAFALIQIFPQPIQTAIDQHFARALGFTRFTVMIDPAIGRARLITQCLRTGEVGLIARGGFFLRPDLGRGKRQQE